MKALMQLAAYFSAKGWLTREQEHQLIVRGLSALSDPGNLEAHAGNIGECVYFRTTGRTTGPLWGTDIYTSDSDLGTAALHFGLLQVGQGGIVKVTMVPALAVFRGCLRNGVSSRDWTTGWRGAYQLERVAIS